MSFVVYLFWQARVKCNGCNKCSINKFNKRLFSAYNVLSAIYIVSFNKCWSRAWGWGGWSGEVMEAFHC